MTKWKKNYKFSPHHISQQQWEKLSLVVTHVNTSETHQGWNISAKFSHCVSPQSPIPTPLTLAASAAPTPSTPASPFLLLIFQCGQVCGVGILAIDLSGLAPAQVCPSTQAQTYFPPSQEWSGSVSWCPVSCTVCVSLLCRDGQGGCMLRQARMLSCNCRHPCIAPSASQHVTSRELACLVVVHIQLGFPQPALKYSRVYNQLFTVSTL